MYIYFTVLTNYYAYVHVCTYMYINHMMFKTVWESNVLWNISAINGRIVCVHVRTCPYMYGQMFRGGLSSTVYCAVALEVNFKYNVAFILLCPLQ